LNKFLFNYYWLASSITAKLFWLILPIIFVEINLFVPFIIFVVALGWSAIMITVFFKCPRCNKRALVHFGTVVKRIESNRSKFKSWLLPNEFVYKYFYCCKCGHKIQSKA